MDPEPAGNWARNKLDLDGDGTFTGGGELDDTGTFNTVNELTARDIDTSGGIDYTLTYDAVGNLTNDGGYFKYVYDAFGRLVTVKTLANAVVAEYTYNGLNHRKEAGTTTPTPTAMWTGATRRTASCTSMRGVWWRRSGTRTRTPRSGSSGTTPA